MKIAIFGTTGYQNRMMKYRKELEAQGHEVRIPAFDLHPELDDFGVCLYNKSIILWAEEIHVFWDQRSVGFVFDFGMIFMAEKPIKIIYLESKTFSGVLRKYESSCFENYYYHSSSLRDLGGG